MNPWDGAPRAGETETMGPAHTVHEAGEVVKINPMVGGVFRFRWVGVPRRDLLFSERGNGVLHY